ncbi:MAG: hypothetical protein RL885_24245 [Planctomycetota bacterium]
MEKLVALIIVLVVLVVGGWIFMSAQERAALERERAELARKEAQERIESVRSAKELAETGLEASSLEELERELSALREEVASLREVIRGLTEAGETGDTSTTSGTEDLASQVRQLREILAAERTSGLGTTTLDEQLPTQPDWRDFEDIRPGMSLRDVLKLVGYPKDTLVYSNGRMRWGYDIAHPDGSPRTCVLSHDGVVTRVAPLVD